VSSIAPRDLLFGYSSHRYKVDSQQGPRAQIDRKLYKKYMQDELGAIKNLTLHQASVSELLVSPSASDSSQASGKIYGVTLGISDPSRN
jgi:tRNA uridine 5-carboxymethylaminomethyl modification enzyme